jgi:hypothetical protein
LIEAKGALKTGLAKTALNWLHYLMRTYDHSKHMINVVCDHIKQLPLYLHKSKKKLFAPPPIQL